MIKNNLTFELCTGFLLLSTYWIAKPSLHSCVDILVGPHNFTGLFDGFHTCLLGIRFTFKTVWITNWTPFVTGLHTLELYSCLNVMSKEKRSAGNEVLGDSILLTKEVLPCNFLEDSAGDSWRNTDTLKYRLLVMKGITADCFGQIFLGLIFDLKGRSDHPNPPPCKNEHN